MLKGAVDTLSVSSPEIISTDIGPVIDEEAKDKYPNGWQQPLPYIRIVPQPE